MASQKKNKKKLKPFQEPLPHFVKLEKKKVERRFVWFTITDWYSDHICW